MQMNHKSHIWKMLGVNFKADPVFLENEVAANLFAAKAMLLLVAALLLSWLLNLCGIFGADTVVMSKIVFGGVLELTVPAGLCLYYRGDKHWLKYLLMLGFTVVQAQEENRLTVILKAE